MARTRIITLTPSDKLLDKGLRVVNCEFFGRNVRYLGKNLTPSDRGVYNQVVVRLPGV
ncbi:hypothetical protein [Mastigocoleus testarum]|uniref:hypothetical protein n=1 Tax=Mastigocoleus testarum TaxID=996925 RepID=UPI00137B50D3|nr:hypothetical protein [Mastigocoleus testarum]